MMADCTPKISGAGLGILIEETPAYTPVPQASSTVAHRNYDSVPTVLREDLEAVYEDNCMKNAIDILGLCSSKMRYGKSQFSEQNENYVLAKSSEFVSAIGICTGVGTEIRDGDADSSLGILKEDDMPGLSEDELDSGGKLLASDNCVSKKIVDAELSDLALDMRHRLQKELSQRAINKISFLSCQSEAGNSNERHSSNIGDKLFPSSKSLEVTTECTSSLEPSDIHNAHGHSEEINEHQICDKTDNVGDSLVFSETCGEMFQNPFDHLKLDCKLVEKMAAMIDLSAEDFIPGDKCEEKLAADECAWKKENIPPAAGTASAAISNLDFSGIVGNAEISLRSVDISHCGLQKKRVSVGEFFRLKSELLGELGKKSNTYFGMQTKSPEKGHELSPLVEVELDEDAAQEQSISDQDCTKQIARTCKTPSFSEGRISSSYLSEYSIGPRESLSLSCIADILAKVDTCASPRTVVSNILKQSGLCNPKGTCPVDKPITSYNSSSVTDPLCAKDGLLKDTSEFFDANIDSQKEDMSSLSHSKNGTAAGMIKEFDFGRKDILNEQKALSDTVIHLLDYSDRQGRLSGPNLMSSSCDEDDSTLNETGSDGWVFSVPNTSVGVDFKTCRKSDVAQILNEEDKNNDKTITLEDSVSIGDVLKLTTLLENSLLDESVMCVTQELASMPRESVDCSALVPALKNKYPELLPQLSELDMKNSESVDKREWYLAVHSVESDLSTSNTLTESKTLVQSMMSSQMAISEVFENKWVTLRTHSPTPVVCVGVPYDMFLSVHNVTDHWILCGLELDGIKLIGQEHGKNVQFALVHLPSKKVLMDPNNCKEAKIKVVPLCEGKLKISLKVHLNDVVTKASQSITCDVVIIGEEPQIIITKNDSSDMILDFGVLPEECAKKMSLKFCNSGSATIPLKLIIFHKVQDSLSTFVLLDPKKQKNKNMAENEVSRELSFTLKTGEDMNVTVMFAAPPMQFLTKQRGFVKLSGVLSLNLTGIIPVELESLNLIGAVGTTKLGMFRPAMPMKLVIKGPGKTDICGLPLRNHGLVPLTLALQILPSDTDSISMSVVPDMVQLQPGEQVEPIVRFSSSRSMKEPVHRMLQVSMQPHGPVYFVEVTGIMTTSSSEVNEKPSKSQSEELLTTVKDSRVCKSKHIEHLEKAPSFGSSKGSSSVKSVNSNGQSTCSSKWHSIKSQSSNKKGFTSEEKLNVKTTHRQLVWGSVAIGKCVTKSFTIRSEDSCKLSVYVYVDDKLHSYELIDSDGLVMGEKCITLHPRKSHSFHVNFKPLVIGAAYGKLVFIIQGIHLIIPMYGFGGHARLIAKGVPRDGAGRMWLMLTQVSHKMEWETSFSLQNFGDLKAFIKIKPITKGFQNVNKTRLVVEPSELVISEGTSTKIRVTYRPQQQDIKLLMSSSMKDVLEVAALSLVSGDEATRLRLRRIHEKNLNMAKRRGSDNPAQNSQLDLQPLCALFPGEEAQRTSDVMLLKDPQDSALDLYSCGIKHQEIILLLENCTDGRSVDATQAFQSMYQYVVDLSTTRQEDFNESGMDEWNIYPSTVTLQPPHLSSVAVLLRTSGVHKHPFEAVVLEHPPGFTLSVNPSAGFIPTSDGVELTVMCTCIDTLRTSYPNFWKGAVKVYIENDFMELNVCIQYPPTHKNGVPVKKLASRDGYMCSEPPISVGQHCAYGSFHASSPTIMSTLSKPITKENVNQRCDWQEESNF
ncbi:uncharacterized protein LOC110829806 isoform X3 [Zootermopsis nevadensis]|nr:uncharacterized protein LOC110829806 isoform X3 [Zootermopsis nevadensis]